MDACSGEWIAPSAAASAATRNSGPVETWPESAAVAFWSPPPAESNIERGARRRLPIPVDAALLREMVRAIVDEVDPDRIILFGSHARRQARRDSDVDLIVIERDLCPERSRIVGMNRLYRTLPRFLVLKDLLVFTRKGVDHWQFLIDPPDLERRKTHILYDSLSR